MTPSFIYPLLNASSFLNCKGIISISDSSNFISSSSKFSPISSNVSFIFSGTIPSPSESSWDFLITSISAINGSISSVWLAVSEVFGFS